MTTDLARSAAACRALLSAVLLACLLVGCATRPQVVGAQDAAAVDAASAPVPLLLISIDGVHPDYLRRVRTPALHRLIREGAHARWMTSVYPSLTFPNHYTMVTGLRPDRHGIVHNTMRDPELGEFATADRAAVGDARWWGGEPLWTTVEKSGQRAATMFWPGSEAAVGGLRPSEWNAFDSAVTIDQRVDRVLEWLSRPAALRPRLVTLYFEHVDKAGHDSGPDAPEVDAALRAVDAGLARLLAALEARGQLDAVNIVVVSDHGMARTTVDRAMAPSEIVADEIAEAVGFGSTVGFAPRPGRTAEAEARLLGRHRHMHCWRKGELPPRWRFGRHPRVPPIVCQMEEGWSVMRPHLLQRWRDNPHRVRGEHGYDPRLPSMRAIFIARGPAFRRGAALAPFENVDVYPLLARLAGVTPVGDDGDIAPLLPALR